MKTTTHAVHSARRLSALALLIVGMTNLRATVIDFEGIGPGSVTTSTEIGDFTLYSSGGNFITFANSSQFPSYYPNFGSDVYYHVNGGLPFSIQRSDTTGFSLYSFDATDGYIGNGSQSVRLGVVGHLVGGGTITKEFFTDTLFGLQTLILGTGWTNLQSVEFGQLYGGEWLGGPANVAFDNIVVDQPGPGGGNPVPDTGGTFGLLGLSLLGVMAVHRRKTHGPGRACAALG